MRVDMLEFLKTGRFGPLVHGLRIEEVERLLGPPWEVGKGLVDVIWVYGSLEVYSYDGLLEGVFLYYNRDRAGKPFRLPACIELVGPRLSRRTTLRQFRELLERAHVAYVEHDFRPVDDSRRVTMNKAPQAVEAWFTGKSSLLHLISYFCEVQRPP